MPYPTTAVDWLCRLIAHKSVSDVSNKALIDDIEGYLDSLGVVSSIITNADGDKHNLLASVYNHGQPVAGGIVLSAHTDVVPVVGQAWSKDPFSAWVADGKVFGRGACDMKGFIACCLALLPQAVAYAKQGRLATPLHLALSFDEEVGCLGVGLLLDELKQKRPDFCLVGEPTHMQVVTAHKGISVYECHITGKACHSSLAPQGVNAIVYAAKMIEFITMLGKRLSTNTQAGFDVGCATLSVGQIQGGTAVNIVPEHCHFVFESRHLPHTDPDEVFGEISAFAHQLRQQMQAIDPNCDIFLAKQIGVPALASCPSILTDKLQHLVGGTTTKVAYTTEAGHFAAAGIATVVCGPGCIDQAHKADEYVAIEQLLACERLLYGLFLN